MMAREGPGAVEPVDLLDGGIAALACRRGVRRIRLAHIPRQPGESRWGSAFQLVYPFGLRRPRPDRGRCRDRRRRALPGSVGGADGGIRIACLRSALGAAVGMTVPAHIVTQIQWPAATLLIAASMWPIRARLTNWQRIREQSSGSPRWRAVRRSQCCSLPQSCGSTTRRPCSRQLALVLVMLRGYSELRHEMRARVRNEEGLRATDFRYRQVADEQAALRRVATLVVRGAAAMRCSRRWQARPSGSSSSTPPRCCAWNRTAW